MMDNSTGHPPGIQTYIFNGISLLEASMMILGNFLIIITVLLTKNLHQKEMLLVIGLAVSDFFYGLASFTSTIHRVNVFLSGTENVQITAWECMKHFHSPLFIISGITISMMMVILSIDRLMAVVWFGLYMSLTKRYACTVLAAVYGYAILCFTCAYMGSYFQSSHTNHTLSSDCVTNMAVPRWYQLYNSTTMTFCSLLSVGIYIWVVVAYRRHTANTISAHSQTGQAAQLARQRRLTETLGLVTLCTFLFHSTPFITFITINVLQVQGSTFKMMAFILWSMVRLNSLVNIFIYTWRHKDIRQAMWAILRCHRVNNTAGVGPTFQRATGRRAQLPKPLPTPNIQINGRSGVHFVAEQQQNAQGVDEQGSLGSACPTPTMRRSSQRSSRQVCIELNDNG